MLDKVSQLEVLYMHFLFGSHVIFAIDKVSIHKWKKIFGDDFFPTISVNGSLSPCGNSSSMKQLLTVYDAIV